jgi:hypothetical protein
VLDVRVQFRSLMLARPLVVKNLAIAQVCPLSWSQDPCSLVGTVFRSMNPGNASNRLSCHVSQA